MEKRKVLVIEDDPEYQELLRTYLRGHEVRAASSMEEIADLFTHWTFDLVICDLNLLGQSGFTLLAKLRESGLTGRCPVIISSSQSDDDTRRRALDMGAAAFVGKPCFEDAFMELIRTVTKK